MGKQVIFYMHPDDLDAFQDFLNSKKLVAFQAVSTTLPIEELSSIKQGMELDAKGDGRLVAIFSKYECDAISLCYNKKRRDIRIDVNTNPMVEFARSCIKDHVLHMGRLYLVPKPSFDFGDGSEHNFHSWSDALLRWVRRHYENRKGIYVSPRAVEWIDSGGSTSQF